MREIDCNEGYSIHNYWVKLESVETKPGCWNYTLVHIFEGDKEIGSYKRNYHNFYHTFMPFEQKGKFYALYSETYGETSVMELPSCKKIAQTKRGFCPVSYSVPCGSEKYGWNGDFAFVAGCFWGDDSGGWKLEFIDLRNIADGGIKQWPKFGYWELPENFDLSELGELIEPDMWDGKVAVTVPRASRFRFQLDSYDDWFSETTPKGEEW